MVTSERKRVIGQLADAISALELAHRTRVGIDGIPAAGKTTLATQLAAEIAQRGLEVIHLTMDRFHQPRARRYRQGRHSGSGYYDDAYDFEAFARAVLVPLGPGGDGRYLGRIRDLVSDAAVIEGPFEAPRDAIVVVDGSFLQRPELAPHWDFTVFVNRSLELARASGLARDQALLGGPSTAAELYDRRYQPAARIYLASVDPERSSTVIVDNDDPDRPTWRVPDQRPRAL
ncbi:MAG: uridine kinase [Acidimicrobiales bacterium]